ncbi:Retrotransposable element Tf2 155 kDa protein type 1 [Carpediemonas membranifera]|uniref:Retrotransposable element Tf2 155 kDa protein type 1 n=1 Tax=Carpediemonas membranifera TaxID=201153 RepID=A0A8J6AW10_9EUKA|nr:Retrotransposable element Tf2 155 kDa protein type 1 [Carpediemonas membranifera]|eukprot:KAG9393905.1 Retrotransposable element Tf2 155 kDa protein type 1 [Carpediemonas membranifera]
MAGSEELFTDTYSGPTTLSRGIGLPHMGQLSRWVDDIMLYARDGDSFIDVVKHTLEICRQYNLRLKAPKCSLGTSETEVVGYVLNGEGMKLAEGRIKSILELPRPRTVKELERLLGSFNYVSKFVQDSSRLLKPISSMKQTSSERVWGDKQEQAFKEFKREVKKNLAYITPTSTRRGDYRRTQATRDGEAYCYNNTVTTGKSTYEQELFAILACLTRRDFSPLFKLKGAPFLVQTDYRNLTFLSRKRDINAKLLRWSLILQDYDFAIEHIPGRENVAADMLSRVVPCTALLSEVEDFTQNIKEAQKRASAEELSEWTSTAQTTRDPDGLYRYKGVPWVPKDPDLRESLLMHAHRRHEGRDKTLEALRGLGFWVGRTSDVADFTSHCPICLKTRLKNFVSTQRLSTKAGKPWETVAIDTVGPITHGQ